MRWRTAILRDGSAGDSTIGVAFKTRFDDQDCGLHQDCKGERGSTVFGRRHGWQIGDVDEPGA
jgi:hypothetical protein